jgi:hypothetical protein
LGCSAFSPVKIYWRFGGKVCHPIQRSFAEAGTNIFFLRRRSISTRLNCVASQSMLISEKQRVFCIAELSCLIWNTTHFMLYRVNILSMWVLTALQLGVGWRGCLLVV